MNRPAIIRTILATATLVLVCTLLTVIVLITLAKVRHAATREAVRSTVWPVTG